MHGCVDVGACVHTCAYMSLCVSFPSQGGEQQLSGDFRVIENPDGSCSFELVNGPGQYVNLKGEKDWTMFKIVSHICTCTCLESAC